MMYDLKSLVCAPMALILLDLGTVCLAGLLEVHTFPAVGDSQGKPVFAVGMYAG